MSSAKLYVGNLNYATTQDSLEELFAFKGEVVSVALVTDRATGRPKDLGSSRWLRWNRPKRPEKRSMVQRLMAGPSRWIWPKNSSRAVVERIPRRLRWWRLRRWGWAPLVAGTTLDHGAHCVGRRREPAPHAFQRSAAGTEAGRFAIRCRQLVAPRAEPCCLILGEVGVVTGEPLPESKRRSQ